ncbi:hypothetical protein ANCCEY_12565 [Ancylostoma ceylanicum]|uniref:Uncharacterized protein n=1 Tax=Ancylostoma ceylanicum TaxID=53326 RepID=A0A0D6LL55_9BILA|nr:hypothetical protein ANCCEY_12565 [Ancylostoma ceylanicum]
MEMDDFNTYRAMCANRLRRLERYKKARSFCNIDDESPSSAKSPSDFPSSAPPFCAEDSTNADRFFGSSRGGSAAFEVIREKMHTYTTVRAGNRTRSKRCVDNH